LSNIPSKESVLAFIRDVLQAGPADKKRREFEELRRQSDFQIATTEEYLDDILSSLTADSEAQHQAKYLFYCWAQVNNFLERNIWVSHASRRHVLWLMATHVYAPGLGRHLAFWDSEKRTDPGMPGGRFWYLPCAIREEDVRLTMPVAQVLDWLLDLLSCSTDELAQLLTSSNTITAREKDSVADFRSIRRTLLNWGSSPNTPGISKIHEFFNNRLQLNFNGTFDWSGGECLDEDFERAIAFISEKGLDSSSLSVETPIPEDKATELLKCKNASEEDKYYLCYHLAQRYQEPAIGTIRKRFLYARAFQATYLKLTKALSISDETARLADPTCNPAIQVVSIFQAAYNLTIGSCKRTDDELEERRLFHESLEKLGPFEGQTTLLSINLKEGNLEFLADQINRRLMETNDSTPIEVEFPHALNQERFLALLKRKAEFLQACGKDYEESHWLNTARSDAELLERIDASNNWSALNSIVNSDKIKLHARRAAAWRMTEVAETKLERAYGFISLLSQLLNDPDKRFRPTNAQQATRSLLDRLKQLSTGLNLEPLILQFEAKYSLSNNDLQNCKKKFDLALDALRKQGFGEMLGQVARDALAVFACGYYPGFNYPACDKYKLLMINYGGLEGPMFYLPEVQEVAAKGKEYFWECLYQPYDGITPLMPPRA